MFSVYELQGKHGSQGRKQSSGIHQSTESYGPLNQKESVSLCMTSLEAKWNHIRIKASIVTS
jgi:hypothetical protein